MLKCILASDMWWTVGRIDKAAGVNESAFAGFESEFAIKLGKFPDSKQACSSAMFKKLRFGTLASAGALATSASALK